MGSPSSSRARPAFIEKWHRDGRFALAERERMRTVDTWSKRQATTPRQKHSVVAFASLSSDSRLPMQRSRP